MKTNFSYHYATKNMLTFTSLQSHVQSDRCWQLPSGGTVSVPVLLPITVILIFELNVCGTVYFE